MKHIKILLLILFVCSLVLAQKRDKGKFVEPKSEYWEQIKKDIAEFNKKGTPEKKIFKMDLTGLDLPKSKSKFSSYWHNDPISQGNTGTCWCFSTTSFLESEVNRINTKNKI